MKIGIIVAASTATALLSRQRKSGEMWYRQS